MKSFDMICFQIFMDSDNHTSVLTFLFFKKPNTRIMMLLFHCQAKKKKKLGLGSSYVSIPLQLLWDKTNNVFFSICWKSEWWIIVSIFSHIYLFWLWERVSHLKQFKPICATFTYWRLWVSSHQWSALSWRSSNPNSANCQQFQSY